MEARRAEHMVSEMTETLIGYDIHASFDGANQFQAANVERRYRVTTDDGTYERRSRGVVTDLASVVPASEMMAQVEDLTAQLTAMTADRDAERTAKEAALAQVASLTTERDGLADDKASLTTELAEARATAATVPGLQSQIDALTAQIDDLQGTIDKGQPNRENLLRYASAKGWQLAQGGVTVNGVAVSTTDGGLALLNGAYALCKEVPSTVISWDIPGDGRVQLAAPQVVAIAIRVGQWVQEVIAKVAAVKGEISADVPTIVTFDQIDQADWPSAVLTA